MEIPEKGPRLRLRLRETQPTQYCREGKGGRDAGLTSLGVPARDIRSLRHRQTTAPKSLF